MSFLPSSRTIPHPVLSGADSADPTEPSSPALSPAAQLDGHLASAIAELSSTKVTPMTTPAPGSFAASLKAMLDEAQAGLEQARSAGRARVGEAVAKLNQAKAATAAVSDNMAKQIEDAASSALSDLGQVSNDLGS